MFTRRTATVTISAPLSSTAARVSAKSLYFPVPTIRRDLNDLPPSSRGVSFIILSSIFFLSAADEVDYLDIVARLDNGVRVAGLGNDLAIYLDRDAALSHLEALEQRGQSKLAVDGIRIAVEQNSCHYDLCRWLVAILIRKFK